MKDRMDVYLITGVAGFIGANLTNKLLEEKNVKIIGIDNLNEYYDVKLKEYRLNKLKKFQKYADTKKLEEEINFKPNTSLREGLKKFAKWYKEYYM